MEYQILLTYFAKSTLEIYQSTSFSFFFPPHFSLHTFSLCLDQSLHFDLQKLLRFDLQLLFSFCVLVLLFALLVAMLNFASTTQIFNGTPYIFLQVIFAFALASWLHTLGGTSQKQICTCTSNCFGHFLHTCILHLTVFGFQIQAFFTFKFFNVQAECQILQAKHTLTIMILASSCSLVFCFS